MKHEHYIQKALRRKIYQRWPKLRNEAACAYVSVNGIAQSCPNQSGVYPARLMESNLAGINDLPAGAPIFIRTDMLEGFYNKYLPMLTKPFSLITGGSTKSISEYEFSSQFLKSLLDTPLLVRWFAQNLDFEHPKVTGLPVGLKYDSCYWSFFETPKELEQEIIALRCTAPALEQRKPVALVNWRHVDEVMNFELLKPHINSSSVELYQQSPIYQETLQYRSNYLFSLCITPSGKDDPALWESISLGVIPIVLTSPLDSLYEGLPVIIVKNLAQITPVFLAKKRQEYLQKQFDFNKIYLRYWQDIISGMQPNLIPPMTLQEFLAFDMRQTQSI
ncbi:hypothetical protein [Polycladidibacter stylochi]|uniref:hypothetical protein n=1 Tax=Polycladidibacter stylochi TaxID=1807766 RepID=UPI0008373B35|nr:hypothetical protein [Pseudovibrio stylochi]